MAELESTTARYGLVLGDSLLSDFYDQNESLLDDLKHHFDLDVILTRFKGGGTISHLAHKTFPQAMTEINNMNRGENYEVEVFLIAGANDMSNAVSTTLDFDEMGFINKRNMDLMSICEWNEVRHLSVFPLTPRRLCRNDYQGGKYPMYTDNKWISFTNVCIRKINKYNSSCVSQKLRFVDPASVRGISIHLASDGLHLKAAGKDLLAKSVLAVDKRSPPKLFWDEVVKPNVFDDEFPPLFCDCKRNPLQPLDAALAFSSAKQRESCANRKTLMVIASSVQEKKEGRQTSALPACKGRVMKQNGESKALIIIDQQKRKVKKRTTKKTQ